MYFKKKCKLFHFSFFAGSNRTINLRLLKKKKSIKLDARLEPISKLILKRKRDEIVADKEERETARRRGSAALRTVSP